jgi:F-type H+-transporting ATPase subunit alpha
VGSAAQNPALKKLVGPLKLSLAQFREVEAFAAFGSELDEATQDTLKTGLRLVELFKQGQNDRKSLTELLLLSYVAMTGHLNGWPIDGITALKEQITRLNLLHSSELLRST